MRFYYKTKKNVNSILYIKIQVKEINKNKNFMVTTSGENFKPYLNQQMYISFFVLRFWNLPPPLISEWKKKLLENKLISFVTL